MSVTGSAPLIAVKDLLWFLYLYPFRAIAGRLPRSVLYGLVRFADPLIQFRSRRQRRQAMDRMVAAGIPAERAPSVARAFVSNAAFRIMDDLVLAGGDTGPGVPLKGIEYLERARARGKGVLLLSVHTFASRAARRYLAACGYPVLTVRNRQPDDALVGRLGLRFLQPRYTDFLHKVIQDEVYIQDPECSLKILKRLRSGGLVNIQLDAQPTAQAMEYTFLGAPHAFSRGPFDIARLSGCSVIPMFVHGRGERLQIAFGLPPSIDGCASGEEFARAHLACFVKLFEEQIMTHPEEWERWTRL